MLAYFCVQDQHDKCTTRVSVPIDEPCSCACHEDVLVKLPVGVCMLWCANTEHDQHVFYSDMDTLYKWCPGAKKVV